MAHVYVVIENGETYPAVYLRFDKAVHAVKEKHKEHIEWMINELKYLGDIESMLADINKHEDTVKGITHLYIEKGINIEIHKLPIV
jgi:hypothetical protein